MPELAVNDVYRVNLYSLLGDQLGKNVLYFKVVSFTAGATDTNLARALESAVAAPMKALMVIDASWRGVGVQRVQPAPTTLEVFGTVGQGVGTVATPPLPRQLAGLITKRTAFAGRSFRGRFYVPFPGEADNDTAASTPIAGYVTRLNTLGAQIVGFQSELDGGVSVAGNYGLFNKSSGAFVITTTTTSRTVWATQRRRGAYGAKNISPI
jgi:hypothetical protein